MSLTRACPARVGEQQQREQPGHLRVAGEQAGQCPGQPDRLLAQVAADQGVPADRLVPGGEDQVDDPEHAADPVRQLGRRRHPQWDPGVPDLALGPDQALRHGRFRDEEHGGDVRRGQPAHGAQGQRHPHRRVEGRVTAGQDQAELVIGPGRPVQPGRPFRTGPHRAIPGRRRFLRAAAAVPAQPVGRLVPGHADQPGPGVARHALGRPLLERRGARVLNPVLGRLEVAHQAGDGSHRRPPVRAEQRLVLLAQPGTPAESLAAAPRCASIRAAAAARAGADSGSCTTGRTSTLPSNAVGTVAAQRNASSRSAQSISV